MLLYFYVLVFAAVLGCNSLFVMMVYVLVNNLSVMAGKFPFIRAKQWIKCLRIQYSDSSGSGTCYHLITSKRSSN